MGHASIITEKLLKKMENNSGVQEQGVIIVEEGINMSKVEVTEIKKVDKSRSGCDETENRSKSKEDSVISEEGTEEKLDNDDDDDDKDMNKRAQLDGVSFDLKPLGKGKQVKESVYDNLKKCDFKCVKCNACFFTGRKLYQHRKTHMALKPLKCDLCDKRLLNPTTLLKHMRIFHKDVVDMPPPKKHVINYERCENPECGESEYKYTSVHVAKNKECREYYEEVYKKSIVEIFDQKRKDKVKARWVKPKGYYTKVQCLDAMSFVKVEMGEDEDTIQNHLVENSEHDGLDPQAAHLSVKDSPGQ